MPGATSTGLAPGASRPVLRGLSDFRVRVQENGIGSMDLSDYGQDHGVPIDPLSVQKIEIFRGPEALRFGSQAVGGVVEATNNRIPFAAPLGGWQTQFLGATTTVDRGLEGGALFDAGTRDFAIHADFYGRHASDYFVPSYPFLFPTDPAPPFNGKQPNSGLHAEGQAVGGSYLFDGGYVGVALSATSLYPIPTLEAEQARASTSADQLTSRASFAPILGHRRRALLARRGQYHHDEISIGDEGIDGGQATFNNRPGGKTGIKFMPVLTPFGAHISAIGTQFDLQRSTPRAPLNDADSARNQGAAYFFNELWLTRCARCWRAASKPFSTGPPAYSHRRSFPPRTAIRCCRCNHFHLPAGDRHPVRQRSFASCGASMPGSSDDLFSTRRDLPRRDRLAVGLAPVATGISASTASTTSCAPRSPTCASRAYRRCGWAAAPVGTTTTGSCTWAFCGFGQATSASTTRPPPATTCSDGNRQPAILAVFAVGSTRSSPASGTTCSTSTCTAPCSSTRMNPAAGRSIKFFMNAKFGGEPPRQTALLQGADRPRPAVFKAPVVTAWSWAGFYLQRHHRLRQGQVQHRHRVHRPCQHEPARCGQRLEPARRCDQRRRQL
jgi:hypothetical protein